MPIFGSSRATSKPGRARLDDERGDPGWPASGSVFAKTVYSPATLAFVMKRFEPSRTYSSPSRRAVVRIAAESEPEPASVSAYAASTSPEASIGQAACPLLLAARELEPERAELLDGEDEPARRADLRDLLDRDEREERPGPRAAGTSSSKRSPKIPCSRKSSTTSHGNSCDSSISAARGAIRSRASVRTSSRISSCSSVSGSQGTVEV